MQKSSGGSKRSHILGSATDDQLFYITKIDPNLEDWRIFGSEWVMSLQRGKSFAMVAMKLFLVDYLHLQQIEANPAKFLRSGYCTPCFYETVLKRLKSNIRIRAIYNAIRRFLDYILKKHFSVEDDFGNPYVPPEFRNPIPALPETVDGRGERRQESDKLVLPYYFIGQLRDLLCPKLAKSFSDWKWAYSECEKHPKGGSWFVVPPQFIDEADPDCVFRIRPSTEKQQKKFDCGPFVHQMWSPVRAVALYLKLQLPLRSYQVRMLDSGEADTQRYVHGRWIRNVGPLAKGTDKNPRRDGFFRQMSDDVRGVSMTGLFINTNKTADIGKDDFDRGYCIPWEHREVLYWVEKLRDWQEKYNPISAPVNWTDLDARHTACLKANSVLKAMGSSCFLFRDPAARGEARFKPICSGTAIENGW